MAIRRDDGSIFSSNTPVNKGPAPDHAIYKVILTKVIYSDARDNLSKGGQNPEVIYEGVTVGGKTEGRLITNIRDAAFLSGGKSNYSERVYRANSKPLAGSTGIDLNKQDGDLVYVAFINGIPEYPIIIGAATNQLDLNNTGSTKSDGARWRWEYNGIFFQIDKNGDLTFTRKGGSVKEPEKYFNPDSDSKVNFSLSGSKLVITTSGGAEVTIDGDTGLIELKDNDTGKIKITGSKIAIGAASVEVLQQISDQLDKIATWAGSVGAAHTHLGNLGYPTAPPTEAPQYTQLQSDLTAIKAKIDSIKGDL